MEIFHRYSDLDLKAEDPESELKVCDDCMRLVPERFEHIDLIHDKFGEEVCDFCGACFDNGYIGERF